MTQGHLLFILSTILVLSNLYWSVVVSYLTNAWCFPPLIIISVIVTVIIIIIAVANLITTIKKNWKTPL